jgi:hypothetical protein
MSDVQTTTNGQAIPQPVPDRLDDTFGDGFERGFGRGWLAAVDAMRSMGLVSPSQARRLAGCRNAHKTGSNGTSS